MRALARLAIIAAIATAAGSASAIEVHPGGFFGSAVTIGRADPEAARFVPSACGCLEPTIRMLSSTDRPIELERMNLVEATVTTTDGVVVGRVSAAGEGGIGEPVVAVILAADFLPGVAQIAIEVAALRRVNTSSLRVITDAADLRASIAAALPPVA